MKKFPFTVYLVPHDQIQKHITSEFCASVLASDSERERESDGPLHFALQHGTCVVDVTRTGTHARLVFSVTFPTDTLAVEYALRFNREAA